MMASVADTTISASQLVAYNLSRIRKALGLSQEQAAERLEPYLGVRWSKAVYSAAERSYQGKRVRQFTAAELAAFALAFGVPVLYFYLPPKPADRIADGVLIGSEHLSWHDLFEIAAGGEQRGAIQQRLDELPVSESATSEHLLAAAGLISWTRVSRSTGESSDYDPRQQRFVPREGGRAVSFAGPPAETGRPEAGEPE